MPGGAVAGGGGHPRLGLPLPAPPHRSPGCLWGDHSHKCGPGRWGGETPAFSAAFGQRVAPSSQPPRLAIVLPLCIPQSGTPKKRSFLLTSVSGENRPCLINFHCPGVAEAQATSTHFFLTLKLILKLFSQAAASLEFRWGLNAFHTIFFCILQFFFLFPVHLPKCSHSLTSFAMVIFFLF